MNNLRLSDFRKDNLLWVVILILALSACTPFGDTATNGNGPSVSGSSESSAATDRESMRLPASKYEDFRIVTLLPRDAIPAIDDPQFITASEAELAYEPDELVIGVEFDSDARAYSVPLLSRHEIVNDTVGGVKIAVTW